MRTTRALTLVIVFGNLMIRNGILFLFLERSSVLGKDQGDPLTDDLAVSTVSHFNLIHFECHRKVKRFFKCFGGKNTGFFPVQIA